MIIDILDTYGDIQLGDIGRLVLKREEAKISDDHLKAPSSEVYFTTSQRSHDQEDTLEKAVKDGIIVASDKEALEASMKEQLAKFSLVGKASLFGLGSLRKEDDEIRWTSLASSTSLPDVSLPSLKPPQKIKPNPESSPNPKSKPPLLDLKTEDSFDVKNYLLPLAILVAGILALLYLSKVFQSHEAKSDKNIPAQDILETASDDIAPFEDRDSSQLFKHPLMDKYKDVLTNDVIRDGCKIVVGSFSKLSNAEVQYRSVVAKGFKSEILSDGNKRRVVVAFDCLEHDLKDYLLEVRRKVSSKSWYLQPEYELPK